MADGTACLRCSGLDAGPQQAFHLPPEAHAAPAGDPEQDARRLFLLSARVRPQEGPWLHLAAGGGPLRDLPWARAAALARRTGQEPLFRNLVTHHFPAAPLSPETLADLQMQDTYHAFRWEEIAESIRDALGALEKRGIRPVLLKGAGCTGVYYDPPRLRPMRDVDLLVREEETGEAAAALEAGGFRGAGAASAASLRGHHHLPPVFHPRTDICFELHHHLMRLDTDFEGFPPLSAIWASPSTSTVFGHQALTLEPELLLLTLCVHVTHADKIGRRAQNLIDLSRLLEVHSVPERSLDWQRITAYARSPDVARALAVPLSYLGGEGLPAPPADVLAEIVRLSGLRRWEMSLLAGLIRRYRIGSPPAWRGVSGRISNILWRQALRRSGFLPRALATAWQVLNRRRP